MVQIELYESFPWCEEPGIFRWYKRGAGFNLTIENPSMDQYDEICEWFISTYGSDIFSPDKNKNEVFRSLLTRDVVLQRFNVYGNFQNRNRQTVITELLASFEMNQEVSAMFKLAFTEQ